MTHRQLYLLCLPPLILLIAGCGRGRISDEQGVVEVGRKWDSAHSLIRAEEFVRVTGQAEWEALWGRHAGDPAKTPVVNFEKDMVLGVFLGEDYNVAQINLEGITEEDDLIRVRFSIRKESHEAEMGNVSRVSLAALYRIPRTDKRIVFEEVFKDASGRTEDIAFAAELPAL